MRDDWPELVRACHDPSVPVERVRELLAAGADPNETGTGDYGPVSALYGAAGVRHDPGLTRLLLAAGADPDDGESLYHSTEAESPECLRLLLQAGATIAGSNALPHALDHDRPEHVRLLLDAGADPNAGSLLAHAVRRGRGPEFLLLLAAWGADLDRPGGEWAHGDPPGRTPYQHAVRRARPDCAATLAELGASTEVSPLDELLGGLMQGRLPDGPLPDELDPDAHEIVVLSALRAGGGPILDLVEPGFRGTVGGSPPGTLLHHAAWVGRPRLVVELLDRGADASAASPAPFSTPLAWAALASQYHTIPGRDYAGVAEQLAAAGAEVEPRFLEVAEGPLLDWLRRRSP